MFIILLVMIMSLAILFYCGSKKEQHQKHSKPYVPPAHTGEATAVVEEENPGLADNQYEPVLSIIDEKTAPTGKSGLNSNFKTVGKDSNKHRLPGTKYKMVDGKLEERGNGKSKMGDSASNPLSFALAGPPKKKN